MKILILILMIIAVLLLLLSALGVSTPRGYNLLALGLAVWALAELFRSL
jgi:hypothetical protein